MTMKFATFLFFILTMTHTLALNKAASSPANMPFGVRMGSSIDGLGCQIYDRYIFYSCKKVPDPAEWPDEYIIEAGDTAGVCGIEAISGAVVQNPTLNENKILLQSIADGVSRLYGFMPTTKVDDFKLSIAAGSKKNRMSVSTHNRHDLGLFMHAVPTRETLPEDFFSIDHKLLSDWMLADSKNSSQTIRVFNKTESDEITSINDYACSWSFERNSLAHTTSTMPISRINLRLYAGRNVDGKINNVISMKYEFSNHEDCMKDYSLPP